jgi:predicted permease
MIQLAIVMALGYLLFKVKLMDADLNRKLSKLLLNCTLPAMILSSVLEQPAERDYGVVAELFAISIIIYLLLPVIAFFMVKVMHIPIHQQGLYMFMFTYSNVGFMGFPVINSIYGSTGVFYAAIVNIIFNVSSFSLGVIMMNYGTEHKDGKLIEWKNLLSPGVSVSVLSILIYLSGITLPADIVSVCDSVGNITTPLSMLLIGATLATMDIKSVFNDWHIYPFTLVKQIAVPFVLWMLLKIFIKDPEILGTNTVLLLMPVANSSVLFANLYMKDEKLAARGVFITTLFSLISVPAMLYFIG